MIDITGKEVTVRTATGRGIGPPRSGGVRRPPAGRVPERGCAGDGQGGGIQAVKATPALIPMCHPILIESRRGGVSPWMNRANRCK